MRRYASLACLLALAVCTANPDPHQDHDQNASETRSAFGAATGITGTPDAGSLRTPRIVPLGPLAGDAQILYGHPDSLGQPFVMRIRELPGTIVPPHTHPVDEHLTVVQASSFHVTRYAVTKRDI